MTEPSAIDVIIVDNDSGTDDIVVSQECDSETYANASVKQEPVYDDGVNQGKYRWGSRVSKSLLNTLP